MKKPRNAVYVIENGSPAWKVPLTKGQLALVDEDDIPLVCDRCWTAFSNKNGFYARTGGAKGVSMHRLIAGLTAEDMRHVDHVNGNTLDNRKENLRICLPHENLFNRKTYRTNTSGFKGVTWSAEHSKWQAQIQVRGKRVYLGFFDSPESAHARYLEAATKHFGEFERTA